MSRAPVLGGLVVGSAVGMVLGFAGQSPVVIGVLAPAALGLYVYRKHREQQPTARDLTHPDEQEKPWP